MKKKRQFKGPAYHGGVLRGWLLAACIGLLVARAGAQGTFAYRSALDTVRATGFYRIILSPELIAKCREDLADLRILGPRGPTARAFAAHERQISAAGGDGDS